MKGRSRGSVDTSDAWALLVLGAARDERGRCRIGPDRLPGVPLEVD